MEDKDVNIILFGPPGAGKGTQADFISKKFNLYKVSTGDLLRNEIKEETKLGNQIESILEKGSFVNDNIINDLVIKILNKKHNYNNIIFDGYPRNINQAKSLDLLLMKFKKKITCVLNLNVEKNSVIKRILGRQSCSKCGLIFNKYFNIPTDKNHACGPEFLLTRTDDNEKTIANRYETYLTETLPVLNFYKKQNLLHEINGTKKIDQIYEEIQGIITSL